MNRFTTCINPTITWPLLAATLVACSSARPEHEDPGAERAPSQPAVDETVVAPNESPASNQSNDGDVSDDTDAEGPLGSPASPLPSATSAAPAAGDVVAVSPNAGATGPAGVAPPTGASGTAGAIALPLPESAGEAAPDDVLPSPTEPTTPVVNPFVDVAHDPLSTFAVDVDTASYDIFRRDIMNGRLPSAETVRVEEFINYFDYDYPAPEVDAAQPFAISLAAAPSLFETGTTLLRVGIQGEQAPEFEKKATNLVFLVDVSGSMQSPEKLPLVQSVLNQALDVLDPSDTISIVTYASGTQVVLAATPVGDKQEASAIIDGLTAGGSTNGEGGIQLAYDQARDAYLDGGINHVVLCTDGDFNVGVSDTNGLLDLIEEERKSGVTFTALGFGESNNDAMMEAVSNAGNGTYAVIANEDQATDYVYDRLLHNITLIAKDVKIQVEFNPELVTAYRLLGYENRAIADDDFRDDRVDAGEIGAEHRVTALYELVLTGQEVPRTDTNAQTDAGAAYTGETEVAAEDLVLVKVRYKDVDATEADDAYEVNTSLHPDDIADQATDLDEDFQWAVAVATFAEVLRNSPFASAALLPDVKALVEPQADRDADRMEFNTLLDTAVGLVGSTE